MEQNKKPNTNVGFGKWKCCTSTWSKEANQIKRELKTKKQWCKGMLCTLFSFLTQVCTVATRWICWIIGQSVKVCRSIRRSVCYRGHAIYSQETYIEKKMQRCVDSIGDFVGLLDGPSGCVGPKVIALVEAVVSGKTDGTDTRDPIDCGPDWVVKQKCNWSQ